MVFEPTVLYKKNNYKGIALHVVSAQVMDKPPCTTKNSNFVVHLTFHDVITSMT